MTYSVKEVFPTLQGEGFHAGRFAVFVRFTSCNLWTGRDEDRERDAERHAALCPRWCDTDFAGGDPMELGDIMEAIDDAMCAHETPPRTQPERRAGDRSRPTVPRGLIVFTGGEPLLQLDRTLLDAVREDYPDWTTAIETNGTVAPKDGVMPDWVCVSPKVPLDQLVVTTGNELKVVYPAFYPLDYEPIADRFGHLFVSPGARVVPGMVGVSELVDSSTRAAALFCMRHPRWRLSLQQHKIACIE